MAINVTDPEEIRPPQPPGLIKWIQDNLFSSLVSVVLFFRVFEIGYYEPLAAHHGHGHHSPEPMDEGREPSNKAAETVFNERLLRKAGS